MVNYVTVGIVCLHSKNLSGLNVKIFTFILNLKYLKYKNKIICLVRKISRQCITWAIEWLLPTVFTQIYSEGR